MNLIDFLKSLEHGSNYISLSNLEHLQIHSIISEKEPILQFYNNQNESIFYTNFMINDEPSFDIIIPIPSLSNKFVQFLSNEVFNEISIYGDNITELASIYQDTNSLECDLYYTLQNYYLEKYSLNNIDESIKLIDKLVELILINDKINYTYVSIIEGLDYDENEYKMFFESRLKVFDCLLKSILT